MDEPASRSRLRRGGHDARKRIGEDMSLTFKEVSAFAHLIDSEPARVLTLDASALPHLQRLLADKRIWVAARAAGLVPLVDDKKAISVLRKAAQSPHDGIMFRSGLDRDGEEDGGARQLRSDRLRNG